MSNTSTGAVKRTGSAKNYNIDMTSGSLPKKMLLFALPLIFSSVLQLLFNAADLIVVGRFVGDEALAAVGSTGALINLLTNLFLGLSVGANVLVARYTGANRPSDVEETVHTALLTSLLSGILLAGVGFTFARPLLELMDTPADVIGGASRYMRIYFLGMPIMMIYNFSSAILRAIGDTRRPLYYLAFAGCINVVMNLIFVIKFIGHGISEFQSSIASLTDLFKFSGSKASLHSFVIVTKPDIRRSYFDFALRALHYRYGSCTVCKLSCFLHLSLRTNSS